MIINQSRLSKDKIEHALYLHRKFICVDMHNHVPCAEDIEGRTKGGLDCKIYLASVDGNLGDFTSPPGPDSFGTAYETDGYVRRAFNAIDQAHLDVNKHSNKIALAVDAGDIIENKSRGRLSVMIGFEGGKPLDGSLALLRAYYRLGLRHLELTWGYANQLCGAQWDPGGLTNFGQAVVKECNRLGIIVDVGHISEAGFKDVLELSEDPILVGHSGAIKFCPNARQPQLLRDEQIKALHEKGGVIGIHFFCRVLTGADSGGLENLLDNIDYIADLVGNADCLGIGTDYFPKKEPWLNYMDLVVRRKDRAPNEEFVQPKLVLDDVSKLQELTIGLVARGYSDGEIEKILGGNFLRVAKRIFRA